jgi:hypothetical protein
LVLYVVKRQFRTDGERADDVTRAFGYSDIHYKGFPSESAEYRSRIHDALDAAAQNILATWTK